MSKAILTQGRISPSAEDLRSHADIFDKTEDREDVKRSAESLRANPYHFPERCLFKGVTFNGVPVRQCPVKEDSLTHIRNIRRLPMRPDDIFIAAYPKCGTHWISEIVHMLLKRSVDYSSRTKEHTMLECMDDLPSLEALPSPRLLNSHLYMAQLPQQILQKNVKVIHIIRNPKDTALSMHCQIKQNASEKFTFENFLKGYMTEGYASGSHQFNYLRQMAKFERDNPDQPILHVHYEDLKKAPVPTIQEVSRFLGVPADQQFCREVDAACSFDRLKQAEVSRSIPENITKSFKTPVSLYRKGVVGDWKNSFTVAQSEMFDQFIARQEIIGLAYTFRWH